jgi:hypothetical protein
MAIMKAMQPGRAAALVAMLLWVLAMLRSVSALSAVPQSSFNAQFAAFIRATSSSSWERSSK